MEEQTDKGALHVMAGVEGNHDGRSISPKNFEKEAANDRYSKASRGSA